MSYVIFYISQIEVRKEIKQGKSNAITTIKRRRRRLIKLKDKYLLRNETQRRRAKKPTTLYNDTTQ